MTFAWDTKGSIGFEYNKPWRERGIEHAFIGAALDFSNKALDASAKRLCQEWQADSIVLLDQVHENKVIELSPQRHFNNPFEVVDVADGMIFPLREAQSQSGRLVVGVRTADCLPVLIKAGTWGAVVHAGWRSLAAGILHNACDALVHRAGTKQIEIVIGPAAGAAAYQVGSEVVSALGTKAVYQQQSSGKCLLNMPATAQALCANDAFELVRFAASERCSISDKTFHSFRRDGNQAGRNLAMWVI